MTAPGAEHRHVHRWEGGDRSFTHTHPMPDGDLRINRLLYGTDGDGWYARAHRHINGRHSHPHGHGAYAG